MDDVQDVVLVPLLAGLHLRYPRFNAVVVEEFLRASSPELVALEPLPEGFERSPAWRDTEELVLPWTVVPWAKRQRVPVVGVHEPSPDPAAPADFARYLSAYPAGAAALDAVAALERPLPELLAQPLTVERAIAEVVPILHDAHRTRLEAFGDGPATDWLDARAEATAGRIAATRARRVAAAVGIDRFAPVRAALERRGVRVRTPVTPPPSDAARERAVLDLAWRGEGADPGATISRLRAMGHAEARYHAANLLLEHGHLAEALEELEGALALELAHPPFLAGTLLARLGQLRDLSGRRDRAVRAYRGVLALEWAPLAAREAATAGIERPFALEPSEPPT